MIFLSAHLLVIATSRTTAAFVDKSVLDKFGDLSMESPANEKPGFYVFQEPKFDNKVSNKALADLRKIQIHYVIRKESDGSFISWNMDGKLRKRNSGDVPTDVLASLEVGKSVVKLTQPYTPQPIHLDDINMFFRYWGDIRVKDIRNSQLTTWVTLDQSKSPYLRQYFRLTVPLEVGKFKPISGTQPVIDGTKFVLSTATHLHQIADLAKETGDPNAVLTCNLNVQQMTRCRGEPLQHYNLVLRVDRAKFKADFPMDRSKDFSYCGASTRDGSKESDFSHQFYVHSNTPSKYWREISVIKFSSFEGYLGHIPTAPLVDKK